MLVTRGGKAIRVIMNDKTTNIDLTRRRTLAAIAASSAVAVPFAAQAQPAATARLLPGANVCVLTPETIEGPYYFDPKLNRADITEGRPGVPLELALQVVEARDCTPLKGARADIWHADAVGVYSGYPGQTDARNVSTKGQHFLRGTQFTDAAGLATFTTIYPGWYQGRTTHIHGKIFLDDKTVLTTQFYFPDALSEFIYKNVSPYNTRRNERDTVNATDMVLKMGEGGRAAFSIREEADRYVASLIVGVNRDAKESLRRMPAAPPPGGPPPGGAGGPPRGQPRPRGSLVPGIVKVE